MVGPIQTPKFATVACSRSHNWRTRQQRTADAHQRRPSEALHIEHRLKRMGEASMVSRIVMAALQSVMRDVGSCQTQHAAAIALMAWTPERSQGEAWPKSP